jgi:hypothetical protein
LDLAIILAYLKVESRLSIPNNSTSKLFVLQILQNISQLQYYTAVVLELLYKRLYSPGSTEQLIIKQLYKSTEIAIYSAVLIASTNKLLTATNIQLSRKQAKKQLYIVSGGILTREEGTVLAEAKANKKVKKRPNRITKRKR